MSRKNRNQAPAREPAVSEVSEEQLAAVMADDAEEAAAKPEYEPDSDEPPLDYEPGKDGPKESRWEVRLPGLHPMYAVAATREEAVRKAYAANSISGSDHKPRVKRA